MTTAAQPARLTPRIRRARALGRTRAVVLVLHGGRSQSEEPTTALNLSVLRLVPFARRIRRATVLRGVSVWRVRYRYRGWNGAQQLPVVDARWALEQVRQRHGDVPVVLIGHSMGGRTAVHVADDPQVCAIVGLAPWLSRSDPVQIRSGCRVAVLHGDADRITSARETFSYAERARLAGADTAAVVVRRGEHFMLRRAMLWHHLGSAFVRDGLSRADAGGRPRRGRAAALVAAAYDASSPVEV